MREAKCVHITGAGGCTSAPSSTTRRGMLGAAGAALLAGSMGSAAREAAAHPDAELLRLLAAFDSLERRIDGHGRSASPSYIADDDAMVAMCLELEGQQSIILDHALAMPVRTADGCRALAASLLLWDSEMDASVRRGDNPADDSSVRLTAAVLRAITAGVA